MLLLLLVLVLVGVVLHVLLLRHVLRRRPSMHAGVRRSRRRALRCPLLGLRVHKRLLLLLHKP